MTGAATQPLTASTTEQSQRFERLGFVLPRDEGGFTTPLELRVTSDEDFELVTPLIYESPQFSYAVRAGEPTDLASVPRALTFLFPRYGRYTKAAVVHDSLCRSTPRPLTGSAAHRRDWAEERFDADLRFRAIMQMLGVSWLKRWLMWSAVTWATLVERRRRLLLPMLVATLALVALVPDAVRDRGYRLVPIAGRAVGKLARQDWFADWRSWHLGWQRRWVLLALVVAWIVIVVLARETLHLVPRLAICSGATAAGSPFLLAGVAAGVVIGAFLAIDGSCTLAGKAVRSLSRSMQPTLWALAEPPLPPSVGDEGGGGGGG